MTTPLSSPRLAAAIADIDSANASDPRQDEVAGRRVPRELLYAERMSARLAASYPDASELLSIAARAQHIRRWEIPRDRYPQGPEGYNRWRTACRDHHAALTAAIMSRHGYNADEIAHVAKIIRKQQLKADPDSQALENVVGVVFVEHYLENFIAAHSDYDPAKLSSILAKTLRKMSPDGHAAVLALPLPVDLRTVLSSALG